MQFVACCFMACIIKGQDSLACTVAGGRWRGLLLVSSYVVDVWAHDLYSEGFSSSIASFTVPFVHHDFPCIPSIFSSITLIFSFGGVGDFLRSRTRSGKARLNAIGLVWKVLLKQQHRLMMRLVVDRLDCSPLSLLTNLECRCKLVGGDLCSA